ncbi:Putative helicase, P-loop containing nucleoside triphosphate hydrolase [Septoria linicola]|uniref:Helicase, P-loop containing nucleoside triphosphate hydrolase n=1 Tax=Septoria linicola TaxID=215465 RepID=A0A9Q9EIC0_9PEZI|nr:Putative helicase, P-loop containing nucleoside triphosphate hydrolase [Septoria linicola]
MSAEPTAKPGVADPKSTVTAGVPPSQTSSDDGLSDIDSSEGKGEEEVDDEFAGQDSETQVLSQYRKLESRRVDLVGDYAGDELFLIEGDSMLRRCFDDDKLDFSPGTQLLHAVYNVEHFLHQLAKRKCNFDIIFFESNRSLCLPPLASKEVSSRYYLARAAIIRHLQSNIAKVHPDIRINVFQSWDSPGFVNYLEATSPYFLMAHDGARAVDRKSKKNEDDIEPPSPKSHRVALRQMILSFVGRGYNVALVNGLEWRDTKIMTMVLETGRRSAKLPKGGPRVPPSNSALPTLDISADVKKLKSASSGLTARQYLAVLTVANLFHDEADVDVQVAARLGAAFLLHQALLVHLPLSGRRVEVGKVNSSLQGLVNTLANTAEAILNSPAFDDLCKDGATSDVFDFIDGRLFLSVANAKPSITSQVKATFDQLMAAVQTVSQDAELDVEALPSGSSEATPTHESETSTAKTVRVLPFSNAVFDKHLELIKIKTTSAEAAGSAQAQRIFREVTHWHNYKKPIVAKPVAAPTDTREARKKVREDRRNQLFMAEMRTYAASLTNSVGKSLEPETIIVGATKSAPSRSGTASPADSDTDSASSAQSKGKPGGKKGGGKTAQKNAGKQAMLNNIAAVKAKKDESSGDKIHAAWQVACKGFEADKDPRGRYRKAKDYLANIQPAWREVFGTEGELYLVSNLLHFWIDACRRKEKSSRAQVAALIWSHCRSIAQHGPLTKSIAKNLELTQTTLKLPPLPTYSEASSDRKLAFTFALSGKVDGLAIELPSREFQLLECGPYLERSFDSKADPRVEFQPDGWQRQVLDTIDANKSAFVVAPTSAGKTFISFYAMRKVLEADDDGVLVYVAPTKALVNQIAAEVQARYSKKFKYGGKSVWAIHTRDYRINNPTGCQVLVTVPHVLQTMLLSPAHANSWSARVKRIIFDEIHSIGQAEDGVVWEQLLLMAPCPIIALSATVGNPKEFSDWLATTQQAIGKELVTVQHPYRYSDLRKYFYVAPKKFGFYGLPQKRAFGSLGLEGLTGFNFVHPVAGLVDKSRGIPKDLSLEPRDCFTLWNAMIKLQTDKHPVPAKLDPSKALPEVSRKIDVLNWEKDLKSLLSDWLEDPQSPYDELIKELEQGFRSGQGEDLYTTDPEQSEPTSKIVEELPKTSTLALLCRLHEQDAVPAIFFNYDRHDCERICKEVVSQLQSAEEKQVKSGAKWEKTLERFEEYKKLKAKNNARNAKATSKKTKLQGEGDEKGSKNDLEREGTDDGVSKWESFDPEAPSENYHFADYTKLLASDLEIYVRQLRRREVPEYLIDALFRGIGVHHAGMNRKYRQVVEILFRKGFLRVIIATGTLALGINMPCKTVVFSGDSVFLTALNYRQCAGRAGRRGFDLLGNVVFQGVSRQKVCRLLSSRLPDLNGHFPITTTLVLRLFTLLHESKNAKYSVNAINALLSQPRMYMGGQSFKEQTMHHLRFSIEYLRRQQLLGNDGAPLNFAGLVSHLYFTENSSFAFHALLKEGYFHELCADIEKNEKDTLETLMMVLSHLFSRIECRQADEEYREKVVKPSSSMVFLPPMPTSASNILIEHNKQTLSVYRAYVETFVDQHIKEDDRTLPLSGIKAGTGGSDAPASIPSLPPSRIRSSFVALSGAGDEFDNIHDLCQTTRDGVFLEEAVIPHMDVYPEEMEVPLNAYLLDFYKHGDVHTIERANRIRRSEIWFLLNDFSLVLATIITSLMNFMKLTEATDLDMLEVMGNMDAHEEAEDDKIAATETESTVSGPSVGGDSAVGGLVDRTAPKSTRPAAPTKKQAKNADSWEDLAGSDDEDDVEAALEHSVGEEAEALAQELANSAWEGEGGEGLKNVLKAFQKLHADFTVKFRAMWA